MICEFADAIDFAAPSLRTHLIRIPFPELNDLIFLIPDYAVTPKN